MKRSAARTTALGTAALLAASMMAIVPADAATADTLAITLDGSNRGRHFEGVGGVFSNGMTELLRDYPAAQREDILRLLFEPMHGAGLQYVKVEIGTDVNSSAGTEPSHMRSATDFDITRGSGLWLAAEAVAINPDIELGALRWGTPQWIQNDSDLYTYYKNFLDGAQSEYGLSFSDIGSDKNEDTTSADWAPTGASRNFVVNTLRPGLDADGYADVGITAADSNTGWWIADRVAADPALKDALYSLNAHYIQSSTDTAKNSGLRLWSGENLAPFRSDWVVGSLDMADRINRMFASGRMTRYEMHPAVESAYPNTPFNFKSILVAQTPWSGNYRIESGVWATAHYTQFVHPGWRYLNVGSAADDRGSYTTLVNPSNSDWSSIFVNTSAVQRTYDVTLAGGLSATSLHRWQSTADAQFIQLSDVAVASSTFSFTVPPYSITSLTTTTGQNKGAPSAAIPSAAAFALPYSEDFESTTPGANPRYTSDQGGAFEVSEVGGNRVLEQKITAATKPLDWKYRETPEPFTLLGSLEWRDYVVSITGRLPDAVGRLDLAGRVNHTAKSDDPPGGYRLAVDSSGAWQLLAGSSTLDSGTIGGFAPTAWNELSLRFHGQTIVASLNGVTLTTVTDHSFPSGHVSIGSSYHRAQFDDLLIDKLGSGSFPVSVQRYGDNDGRLTYSGAWVDQNGNYDTYDRSQRASRTAGDTLVVRFNGTSISLVGTRDIDGGRASIAIDGVPVGTLDAYAPQREHRRGVFTVSGLSSGTHELTLTVSGTADPAAIDHMVRIDAVETLGGSGISQAAGTTSRSIVFDDFDRYPVGTLAGGFLAAPDIQPLNWTVSGSGGSCSVQPGSVSGTRAFTCVDTSSSSSVTALRSFARRTIFADVSFTFDQSQVGQWTRFFLGTTQDTAIEMYDATTGLVIRDSDEVDHVVSTLTPNTPVVVRVRADLATSTADVWIDGSLALSGVSFTRPEVTQIDRFSVRTGAAPTVTIRVNEVDIR